MFLEVDIMRNNSKGFILVIILIVMLCLTFSIVFADAGTVQSNVTYKIVEVKSGDSLWNIAGRYVTNREDIRDKIAAINKVNHLDSNSKIYPGQALKIPVESK